MNSQQIRFTVSSAQAPRYIIALENSRAMDARGHWELIMRAVRKTVQHDLPDDAHLGESLGLEGKDLLLPGSHLNWTPDADKSKLNFC